MTRARPIKWRGRGALSRRWRSFELPVVVFVVVFVAATYVLTPTAPGRADVDRYISERTTDQHFANCAHARANGRENIPSWDPSYRSHMDGDGDGMACEPWRS